MFGFVRGSDALASVYGKKDVPDPLPHNYTRPLIDGHQLINTELNKALHAVIEDMELDPSDISTDTSQVSN